MIYLIELIGVFFQKPMIFGYNNAVFGLFLMLISLLLVILTLKKTCISKVDIKIYIICLVFMILNSINNYFLGAGLNAINEFLIGFVTITSLFFVFISFNNKKNKIFAYVFGFLILSTFITIFISGFNVDEYEKFILFEFSVKDRHEIDVASVIFPFSTIPWRMTLSEIVLPRATFLAIEPGVGVFILILWRYICKDLIGIKSILADIFFVLGLLLTASTTVPLMLLCWFVIRYVSENGIGIIHDQTGIRVDYKKLILILFFSLVSLYLFFYMPFFGYFDKVNTHGDSFDERGGLYSSDTAIFRYIRIFLLILFYFYIRKLMSNKFIIIYSAMFIISVLNVFAFTPIFYLTVFLSKRINGK